MLRCISTALYHFAPQQLLQPLALVLVCDLLPLPTLNERHLRLAHAPNICVALHSALGETMLQELGGGAEVGAAGRGLLPELRLQLGEAGWRVVLHKADEEARERRAQRILELGALEKLHHLISLMELLVQTHSTDTPASLHVQAQLCRRGWSTLSEYDAIHWPQGLRLGQSPHPRLGQPGGELIKELTTQATGVDPRLRFVLDIQHLLQHASPHPHL
mmetsp:Transcript_58204/g.129761  ORF Transcript_58204/g.129761 Transcript_58204/m.129761 type:complete len:218 (-) Transcript_58204:936-1589(-)